MLKKKAGRPFQAKNAKEFLSSLSGKKFWEQGKALAESSGVAGEYDDGKYRAKIVSSKTGKSQSSGRFQHTFGFKFLDGEYKGQNVYQYQGLEHEVGISILIQSLKKLGFEIEDPSELENIDNKISKKQPTVDIRLKTNGEFQNVIIVKAEGEDDDADVDEDEESDDTENDEDNKPSKKVDESDNDDDGEETEEDTEEDAEADEEEEEEKPKKKKSKVVDEEDEESESEDEDEEEEKPKKSSKKSSDEDDDEDAEDSDDETEEEEESEDKVILKPGLKLKINYDDEEVTATLVKIVEEKKDGTGRLKVKLKNGDKVVINFPEDVVDTIE